MPAIMKLGKFNTTGPLGDAYEPFAPSGEGSLKRDMQLHVDPNRLDDRRHLLGSVDQWRAAADKAGSSGSLIIFIPRPSRFLAECLKHSISVRRILERLIVMTPHP